MDKNIFLLSNSKVEENIKENSYIKSANVKKEFPDKIKINIEERGTEYILQLANNFVYINRQGIVLEISNEKLSVPLIEGLSSNLVNIKQNETLDSEDIEKLKTISKIMEVAEANDISKLITKIDAKDSQNYVLFLESKNKTIYIGNGEDLNTRFLYIKAILKEKEGKNGEIFINMNLNDEYPYFKEN